MGNPQADIDKLLRYCRQLGCDVVRGGKHYKVYKPGSKFPIAVPATTSDVRAYERVAMKLRRHGIPIPNRGQSFRVLKGQELRYVNELD